MMLMELALLEKMRVTAGHVQPALRSVPPCALCPLCVVCQLALAERCLTSAGDLSGLLLLLTAQGRKGAIRELAATAKEEGQVQRGLRVSLCAGEVEQCINLLVER